MGSPRWFRLLVACVLALTFGSAVTAREAGDSPIRSAWIARDRIMVIYNTTRMDSVASKEKDSFSRDIGAWYMRQYGMPYYLEAFPIRREKKRKRSAQKDAPPEFWTAEQMALLSIPRENTQFVKDLVMK